MLLKMKFKNLCFSVPSGNVEGCADLDAACIAGTGYLIGKTFNITDLTGEKGKEGICLPTGAAV